MHNGTIAAQINDGFAFNDGWAEFWAGECISELCMCTYTLEAHMCVNEKLHNNTIIYAVQDL